MIANAAQGVDVDSVPRPHPGRPRHLCCTARPVGSIYRLLCMQGRHHFHIFTTPYTEGAGLHPPQSLRRLRDKLICVFLSMLTPKTNNFTRNMYSLDYKQKRKHTGGASTKEGRERYKYVCVCVCFFSLFFIICLVCAKTLVCGKTYGPQRTR